MTKHCCHVCRRELTPAEDGRTACAHCTDQIRAWLAELPYQRTVLEACLIPDTAPGTGRAGGTGRAHSPIPARLDALNLLAAGGPIPLEDPHGDQSGGIPITAVLHGWARHITYEIGWGGHGPAPRHGTDTAAWCTWLTAYLPYAATRSWVVVMYEELAELLARVRQITALTPRRRPKDAPCPGCEAFALVEVDGERYIRCEACPRVLTHDEYLAHRDRVMPALARIALLMAASQARSGAA